MALKGEQASSSIICYAIFWQLANWIEDHDHFMLRLQFYSIYNFAGRLKFFRQTADVIRIVEYLLSNVNGVGWEKWNHG